MNNPAKTVQPAGAGAAPGNASNDQAVIDKFFGTWATFVQLPASSPVRAQVKAFIAADSAEDRRAVLDKANLSARLLTAFSKNGVLRPDQANGFADAIVLSRQKLADAIRGGNPQEPLGVLQKAFCFGRSPAVPNQQAAVTFLLELWSLHVGGASMKYCTYAKGLPFSAGGKTHEEMARIFVASGFGSGNPLAGGQIARRAPLNFEFDTACTAFRGGMRPEEVLGGFQRWIRATGGDETKVNLKLVAAAG